MRTVTRLMLVATLITGGCNDVTFGGLSEDDLAGRYEASAILIIEGGTSTNIVEQGATIDILLNANGSTTGTMFIPGGNDDGSNLTASLAGSWDYNGSMVTFSHSADTFLRDMDFTPLSNRLVGDATFSGTRIIVTLVRR